MEFIHNTKKRMPFILGRENELHWIDPKLTKEGIIELTRPLDENERKAEVIEK